MLTAVQGFYDNNAIVLNEGIKLTNGQKIILTVLEAPSTEEKNSESKNRLDVKQQISDEEAWDCFLKGINGFTDDFMADGREEFIPSRRETL